MGSDGASVDLRLRPTPLQLAELTRQLLVVLGRISGLESTYLTLVDFEQQVQQILYARNTGDLEIPEGLQMDWTDTLCRRALEGGPARTSEVPRLYPDSGAARDLGIQTYVTVPVVDPGGERFGTLCGASSRRIELVQGRQGRHGDPRGDDRLAARPRCGSLAAPRKLTIPAHRALTSGQRLLRPR